MKGKYLKILVPLLILILITAGCVVTPPPNQTTPITTTPATTTVPTTTTQETTGQTSTQSVMILSPKDAATVEYRTQISGNSTGVRGTNSKIYLVIQPHESGEYYVQPAVVILPDGNWSTLPYFGSDATNKDSGKKFSVFLILTSTQLQEGNVSQIPTNDVQQQIELTRI